MPDSEVYRKNAEECMAQATRATDAEQKRQYQLIAEGWMKLALSTERRERRDKRSEK
jgi:hypothetical protein